MALYPNYDRDDIFKPIGKSIARFNELVIQEADQETIFSEQITESNESVETRNFLKDIMDERARLRDKFETMRTEAVEAVIGYLTTGVAEMLDVIPLGVEDLLAEVLDALEDAMYLNGDKVDCQVVLPPESPPPGAPDTNADIDNQGVGSMIVADTYPQQVHDELDWEIECFNDAVEGSELWTVKNDKEDGLGTLTTGVLFSDAAEKYGHTFQIDDLDAIQEGQDPLASFSNFVLNGAVKRLGNEYSTAALNRSNSDFYGVYYYTLTDIGGGNRQVDVYLDSGHTIKVATGTRAGDGTVILAAVGGSGLTGSVDIVYSADTSTSVKYPFKFKVGDRYYFKSSVETPKIWQKFFVDQFDRALPCGTPVTVLESWAQPAP